MSTNDKKQALVARLSVRLLDVEQRVTRTLEVPTSISLAQLHHVLQAAMPWPNAHLHEFRVGSRRWGLPNSDFADFGIMITNERKSTLADLMAAAPARSFVYLYDFGDGWEHEIVIEDVFPAAARAVYPRLLAIEGTCPPDDIGGPWGYQVYLEALADPFNDHYADLLACHGFRFDPNRPPVGFIRTGLRKLARRWMQREGVRRTAEPAH